MSGGGVGGGGGGGGGGGRDKSTTFEELICNCFKHAPVYTSQISDVWMWKDFPRL